MENNLLNQKLHYLAQHPVPWFYYLNKKLGAYRERIK